ncbi:hypothetical protein [Bacillus altitudinis]|uniref:hypothetical protein n=1 Tax=Bacillus altitudinis TaxID=293387 RepID=UPI0020BF943D|nr:hypothetical protein [Bacillus altitudinis]
MAKYKTEKRKARVGERILITNVSEVEDEYENGDVFEVDRVSRAGSAVSTEGDIILDYEYEVIVGEHTLTPNLSEMDYDELVALVEDAMKALRTRSYKLGYDQGRFDAEIEEAHGTYEKPDQQKRDEIVEKAKEDVRILHYKDYIGAPDFIVNAEKRTVVALRKSKLYGHIKNKGIAKCAPTDCFNAHIGKAIALRRSLGLEVPVEYLNVPQPTEIRVGDVVEATGWAGYKRKFKVQRIDDERVYGDQPSIYAYLDQASRHGFLATDPKIVDDSRAGEGE